MVRRCFPEGNLVISTIWFGSKLHCATCNSMCINMRHRRLRVRVPSGSIFLGFLENLFECDVIFTFISVQLKNQFTLIGEFSFCVCYISQFWGRNAV